jgi:serine/threonine-protein kinase
MHIGNVTVLEELGSGAGSRVYLVRRDEDGRDYALKVLHSDAERRQRYLDQFENEFRIGHSLHHPNLIAIYALEIDVGWFSGTRNARLLTEYAQGRPMSRLPLVSTARLLRILEQAAAAVAYLHEQGVIHADIKPNNFIISEDDGVKLIDLGIAQLSNERREDIHGTREYMAPETARQHIISERTDIYSFGATMYRLATLHDLPPGFKGTTHPEYQPVTRLNPRIPTGLSTLIGSCLSRQPEVRPASMSSVCDQLIQLVHENTDDHSF